MKNILVLGANGQLGSDIVNLLALEKNINTICFTRNNFDIETNSIQDKLANIELDYIINCTAVTNVDSCEDNSLLAFKVNTDFCYTLAKYCLAKNIILIHVSTDYIFDGKKAKPYTEDDIAKPLNIYGLSKLAGEMAIVNYLTSFFIFRVSALFGKSGATGKGGNFITTMQKLATTRDSISVIANQVTVPTSTLALSRCIKHFIVNNIADYGIYNCVSNNVCSWYDFAYQILKLSALDTNKLCKISFEDYKFKAIRPKHTVLSIEKLNKYFLMPSIEASLVEYLT